MIDTGANPTNGKCPVHWESNWGAVRCYGREWDPAVSGHILRDNQKQQGACKCGLLTVTEQVIVGLN